MVVVDTRFEGVAFLPMGGVVHFLFYAISSKFFKTSNIKRFEGFFFFNAFYVLQ